MSNTIVTLLGSTVDTNTSSTLLDNSYDQTQSNDQESKSDDGHGSCLGNEENDFNDETRQQHKNKIRSNV